MSTPSLSQQAYDAGFQSIAAFQRHCANLGKRADLEATRQANTVAVDARSTERFYQGGVPPSKLKVWQEQQATNTATAHRSTAHGERGLVLAKLYKAWQQVQNGQRGNL